MHAKDLLQRIFAGSQLADDQIDQIMSAVDFCLDGNLLSYQLNAHVFPHHMQRSMDGQRRSFEIDWNPIVDEEGNIQKLLICMRDTTELNELRLKTLESEKRVKIVAELLDKNHPQIMTWLDQAIGEIHRLLELKPSAQNDKELIRQALRALHTQKGNARSLGLVITASSIHECEQLIVDIQKSRDLSQFSAGLAGLLHELDFTRNILKSLGAKADTLARQAPSQASTLCICVANALEQLGDLAARLGKEPPECHGLDLLQAQNLRLPQPLEYALRGALNHVLTNIMDHGLESRAERLQQGKPARGHISFYVHEDDTHLILQISDDGRGLNRSGIEEKLRRAGREVPKDAQALVQLLLESGFSTKDDVSDISGRGLGLDAVAAALQDLGGRFRIQTRERIGGANPQLIFTLELPKDAFELVAITPSVA